MKGFIWAAVALFTLCGCGNKQAFTVEAKIDDLGTQNLTVVWRSAPDGTLAVREVTAVGNAFTFEGTTSEPTLVEVFTAQKVSVMKFMVAGGDEIRLRGTGSDLRVSGSEVGQRFAEILNRVNEESDPTNAIAQYVRENPSDLTAAALFVAAFDSRSHRELADSLLSTLKVRPQWLMANLSTVLESDSVAVADALPMLIAFSKEPDRVDTFSGAHTYVFSIGEMQRTASLRDSMARGWDNVVEVFFATDRSTWLGMIEPDSAKWVQVALPDGPASPQIAPLKIEQLPLVVRTDSAGRIIDRFTIK